MDNYTATARIAGALTKAANEGNDVLIEIGTIAVQLGIPRSDTVRLLEYNFSRRYDLPWWRVVDQNGELPKAYNPVTRFKQVRLLQMDGTGMGNNRVTHARFLRRL